jgi:hypothetical protein
MRRVVARVERQRNPGYTVLEKAAWSRRQIHAIVDLHPNRQPEESAMRISAFVALMPVTVALMPRPAVASYNLPWCANYYDSNVIACSFTSFTQCMASVSGVGGHCIQNVLYPPAPPYVEPHRAKSRRAS